MRLSALQALTEGQRLAMLALVPVAAVAVLAIFSTVSRLRYDVLPGMERHREETTVRDRAGLRIDIATPQQGTGLVPESVLAQPGFWSNRHTRHLSQAHVAASVFLTTAFVAGQAAAGPWRAWFTVVFWIACVLLVATAVLVWSMPTMTPTADTAAEDDATRGSRARIPSIVLLVASGVLFLVALGPLAIAPGWSLASAALLPADAIPLTIVAGGAVLALTGIWWRRGGRRKATAWFGCAPAVLMTLALTVGVAISSIVVVTTADWLNGAQGPAALIGQGSAAEPPRPISLTWVDRATGATGDVLIGEAVGPSIRVSSIYVVLGTLIVAAILVTLVVAGISAATKRIGDVRATAWGAPTTPEHIVYPAGGVLPPSRRTLLDRIVAARTRAARLHVVEPVAGVLATAFGTALALSLAMLLWASTSETPIVTLLPWPALPWEAIVANTLNVGIWLLAVAGIALLVLLAAGGSGHGTRPLGTVWDLACFLPRTGHPFGPPCYAERAVPELAGHLSTWLQRDDRRAVLSAHSMGAVLSLAALGLLASSARTRPALARISLLTYGVQLRPIFGRILPELLGPDVLGLHAAAPPRIWAHDPWDRDFAQQRALGLPPAPPTRASRRRTLIDRFAGPERPTGTVSGTLLRAELDGRPAPAPPVRWVSLWRLTDYLGYPSLSTAPAAADGSWTNDLDRIVDELDTSGYLVSVGTHNAYYRTSGYTEALLQLARKPRP